MKRVSIPIEISNEMYRLHHENGWSFAQISKWLLKTHQIKYSSVSVHRHITKMLGPKLTDSSSAVDLESITSLELMKKVQKRAYKVAEEYLAQGDFSAWRDGIRVCMEATSLLHSKFDGYEDGQSQEPSTGVQIPKFIVVGTKSDGMNAPS